MAILKANKEEFSKELFHYNYGTVLYKLENYPAARYHFEIAKKNGLNNTELNNNLAVVKQELYTEQLDSFKSQFLYKATSFNTQQYLSLTLLFLILGLVFYKSYKKVFIVPLFLILSLLPIGFKLGYVDKLNPAICLEESTIYEGPSEIFSSYGQLPAGMKVIIDKRDRGWSLIKSPENMTGWVRSKDLGGL